MHCCITPIAAANTPASSSRADGRSRHRLLDEPLRQRVRHAGDGKVSRPSGPQRKTYRTRDEAKADVFDYIERFYNAKRKKTLDNRLQKPHGVRDAVGFSF